MNTLGSIEVCRTCATPPEKGSIYISLFKVSGPMKCVSIDITEIIEMLQLNIKQNDGLPQIICFSCLKTLAVICEFWKRCEDVQRILSFYRKSAQPCHVPKRIRNNDGKGFQKANIKNGHLTADNGSDDNGNRFTNSGQVSIDSKANNKHISMDFDLVGGNTEYGVEKTEIEFIDEKFINGISSDDDIDELNTNTDWECEFSIDSNVADDGELLSSSAIENNDTAKNTKEETTTTKERTRKPKKEKSQCPYCHRFFQAMSHHVPSCPARPSHVCKYCDLALGTDTELNEHVEKMHPEGLPACHLCFATFENIAQRRAHVRKGHTKVEYKCEKCDRIFHIKCLLDEHMARRHTEVINRKCDLCHKVLKTEFLFQKHLKQHKMEDKLKCRFCGKMFTRVQFKLKHERVHTGETPILCEICGIGFAGLVDLHQHKKRAHLQPENDGKVCLPMRRLARCYKPKEPDGHKSLKKNRFKCALCSREFATSYGLDNHLKLHTEDRKYVCEQCGSGFHRPVHLKMHERRMHSNVKRFSCPECGKMFHEKHELNLHVPIHKEERPLECPHCPATFKLLKRLKKHMTIHSSAKPYVCRCCGKSYKCLGTLRDHFQTHTPEEIQEIERQLLCDIKHSSHANLDSKTDEENIIEESESEQIEFDYVTEI